MNLFLEAFEEVVRKNEDKIAVRCGDVSWRYRELSQEVNKRAQYLLARSLSSKDFELHDGTKITGIVVGLHIEPSPNHIAWMLAIWKARMVYAPLTTKGRHEYSGRFKSVLGNLKPAIIITEDRLKDYFDQHELSSGLKIVCPQEKDYPVSNIGFPTVELKDLAYIMPTSGSTGTPKLVFVSHRGILKMGQDMNGILKAGPDDFFGQIADIGFDAHIQEIVCGLLGFSLVVIPMSDRDSSAGVKKYCEGPKGISIMTLVPARLEHMNPEDFPSLKKVISTGAKSVESQFKKWIDAEREMFDGYGVTEATVANKMHKISSMDEFGHGLGDPSDGLVGDIKFVLRPPEFSEDCGKDEEELVIAAKTDELSPIALGYYEESFKDKKPFFDEAGRKCYRTGDIVDKEYFDEKKLVVIKRRLGSTRVVKINSEYINLEGVEHELKKSPLFEDVYIDSYKPVGFTTAQAQHTEPLVRAFVVKKQENQDEEDTIREAFYYLYNLKFFPVLALPKHFVFLLADEFKHRENDNNKGFKPEPSTGNKDPYQDKYRYIRPERQDHIYHPSLEYLHIYGIVTEVWRKVLCLPENFEFKLDDDFFLLGGDSMRCSWMISDIEKELKSINQMGIKINFAEDGSLVGLLDRINYFKHGKASGVGNKAGYNNEAIFFISSFLGNDFSELEGAFNSIPDTKDDGGPKNDKFSGVVVPAPNAELLPARIEGLAHFYITWIMREFHPLKEYFLVGYCFGGVVAREMVRQLRLKNIKAEALMLDTYPITAINAMPLSEYASYLKGAISRLIVKNVSFDKQVFQVIGSCKESENAGLDEKNSLIDRVFNLSATDDADHVYGPKNFIRSASFYRRELNSGEINLVSASKSQEPWSSEKKWTELGKANKISVFFKRVDASHFSLVEEEGKEKCAELIARFYKEGFAPPTYFFTQIGPMMGVLKKVPAKRFGGGGGQS